VCVGILAPDTELGQPLQRSAPRVEQQLLASSLYQGAWCEAVHDCRWASRTQQGHGDLTLLSGGRCESDEDKSRTEFRMSRESHVQRLDKSVLNLEIVFRGVRVRLQGSQSERNPHICQGLEMQDDVNPQPLSPQHLPQPLIVRPTRP
jgi:hypothetical protein